MKQWPEFVRSEANRVAGAPDPGMAGYVFDGADGTQVVFWSAKEATTAPEHVHDFWEYCLVVEGSADAVVGGKPMHVEGGEEYVIPAGVKHSSRSSPGYRSIDVFGGRRFRRAQESG